ncbi:MAG: hypothetical protein HY979_01390 [Candidatus Magasanikbacteria bacterium]|nr:hypothetical protein [Candidatus Magasanikbacteria bacterium]
MLGKKKKEKRDVVAEPVVEGYDVEQIQLIKSILENTQASIKKALELINDKEVDSNSLITSLQEIKQAAELREEIDLGDQRVIEGVFNGEKMIGSDGAEYVVPANYASKSKLVEGDILKLSIGSNGSFIYKQIGPTERKQLVTTLAKNEGNGQWYAVVGNNRWKLLTASVTYFHGLPGDEIVILIPKDGKSNWAAVENIIKINS